MSLLIYKDAFFHLFSLLENGNIEGKMFKKLIFRKERNTLKKSFHLLFLLITSLFILTGCSSIQDHVVIRDDGNIIREIVITIDQLDENYSEEAEQLALEKIQKEAEEQGYKYDEKHIVHEGKKVVRLAKEMELIDKNNTSINLFGDDKKSMFTISKQEGFFSTHYITNGKVAIPDFLTNEKEEELVTYQLNIHFPSEVHGDNNAQHVTEDGKTLSWKPDKNNEITLAYDASLYDYGHIYTVAAPVIIILILIFYFYYKNKRPVSNNRRIPIKDRKRR